MTRKFRVATFVVVFLALALWLSVSMARAAQSDEPASPAAAGEVTSAAASPEEQRASRRMWSTRRARMEAQPLNVMGVTAEELAAAVEQSNLLPSDGAPGFAPGSAPEPGAQAAAELAFPEEWAAAAQNPLGPNPAIPFTSFLGNYYTQYWKTQPWRMIGRMSFRTPGSSWCTAAPIGPNTIVTAAHCVFDTVGNKWYTNMTFCPAYRNGACPYGQFVWTRAWIPNGYVNAPAFASAIRYDVAVVEVGSNSTGKGVHQAVGYFGRSWNQGYIQNIRTVGYPAKYNSGQYTWVCDSTSSKAGTDIMQIGCNSGGGHSGGPWVRSFGVNNWINNVMSYEQGVGNPNNIMGAARFSSSNIVVLCNAAPGC